MNGAESLLIVESYLVRHGWLKLEHNGIVRWEDPVYRLKHTFDAALAIQEKRDIDGGRR